MERSGADRESGSSRPVVMAEGVVLILCTGLFSELIIGQYEIPFPPPETSLLARHVTLVLLENSSIAAKLIARERYRSQKFSSIILPQAEATRATLGYPQAYTAAVEAKNPQPLLDIYECATIHLDSMWYTEVGGLSRYYKREKEDAKVTRTLPRLGEYIYSLGYVTASIVSDKKREDWDLPSYMGNAIPAGLTSRMTDEIISARL